jgi:hypothetical protein
MNKIIKDILPPIIFRGLKYTVEYIKYKKYYLFNKKILDNNLTIEKSNKKRAFLVATGPSIKEQDLILLKDEDVFSISNFYLHKDLDIVNPKIHFFAPYHEPLILENYIDWLKDADEKLPKNTMIGLGHKTKEIIDKYNIFKDRKVYYFYLSSVVSEKSLPLNKPILSPQTGVIMMFQVLFNMGYKEINLLGLDHTWILSYKNGIVDNFYDKKEDKRKNAGIIANGIYQEFQDYIKIWEQYQDIKYISDKLNIQIYNLSPNSMLDIFQNKKYEEQICL